MSEPDLLCTDATSDTTHGIAANAQGDSPQYTEHFIAWIAMWCTFFILLFFALAGCRCLKNMKFKQDSLLYGKNKAD